MAQKIIPIAMPKWGMEMVEGQIAKWSKTEGDPVGPGDELVEIETDKMTNVYEMEFSGVLRRRIGVEGEIYPVGQLIAVIADAEVPDSEIDAFVKDYKGGAAQAAAAAPAPAAPAAPAPQPAPPQGYNAPPRPLAPAPAVQRSDAVRAPGLDAAAVEAQIRALGTEISPIAARVAVNEGLDVSRAVATGRLGRVSLHDLEVAAGHPVGARTRRLNASPRARRLAREHGVALDRIRGSGRGGRIHAADVLAAKSAQPAQPGPSVGQAPVQVGVAGYRSEANSAMRRTIARRLVQSKTTTPHIYLRASAEMTELLKLREGFNRRLPQSKVSINDLLIRACGLALAEVPEVNVQYTDDYLHCFDQADICVAIALPQGLVAPVIRGADKKPVAQIADEVRALAARARAGGLTAADLEGGTFTVSNLGMFGVESFDAVINPPQAAILAVGAMTDRAVDEDGAIRLRPFLSLTLSCDHRAIDGAVGARYLAALKGLLENPVSLVM